LAQNIIIICYVFDHALRGICFFLSNRVLGGKRNQLKKKLSEILKDKKWISGQFRSFIMREITVMIFQNTGNR